MLLHWGAFPCQLAGALQCIVGVHCTANWKAFLISPRELQCIVMCLGVYGISCAGKQGMYFPLRHHPIDLEVLYRHHVSCFLLVPPLDLPRSILQRVQQMPSLSSCPCCCARVQAEKYAGLKMPLDLLILRLAVPCLELCPFHWGFLLAQASCGNPFGEG